LKKPKKSEPRTPEGKEKEQKGSQFKLLIEPILASKGCDEHWRKDKMSLLERKSVKGGGLNLFKLKKKREEAWP